MEELPQPYRRKGSETSWRPSDLCGRNARRRQRLYFLTGPGGGGGPGSTNSTLETHCTMSR